MSTKCTLTVRDELEAFSVYRHEDGQPHGDNGVFASLGAMPDYLRPGTGGLGLEAADLAACIVAAWKHRTGNVRLSKGRDRHGDTEFHYEVTSDNAGIYVEAFERSWHDLGSAKWRSVAETTIRPAEQGTQNR